LVCSRTIFAAVAGRFDQRLVVAVYGGASLLDTSRVAITGDVVLVMLRLNVPARAPCQRLVVALEWLTSRSAAATAAVAETDLADGCVAEDVQPPGKFLERGAELGLTWAAEV